MTVVLPVYELTVYDSDDSTPLFDVSTDPAHARPYLKAPTSFPEQEVNFAKGSVSIGQLNLQVVDVPTDPTDQNTGFVTAQLPDATGYSALIGHRALLTEDLGGGVATILDGVVRSVMLLDTFSSFELELRDIREREREAKAFENTTTPTVLPRGVLDGYATFWSAGVQYLIPPTEPLVATYFENSPTRGQISFDDGQANAQIRQQLTDAIGDAFDSVEPLEGQPGVMIHNRIKVLWRDLAAGGAYTEITQIAYLHPDLREGGGQQAYRLRQVDGVRSDRIFAVRVNNEVSGDTLPSSGQRIEVIVQYDGPPTEDWRHHIQDINAGELLRDLYRGDHSVEDPRIRFNETALLALSTRVRGRLKEPIEDIRAWAEENVYPIVHAAPTLNSDGEIAPITYILPDADETLIDLDNNNCRPTGAGWAHGAEDAVNVVKVTYKREFRGVGTEVLERDITVEFRIQDSIDLLGEQELEVDSILLTAVGTAQGGPAVGDVRLETGYNVARRLTRLATDRFALGGQYFSLLSDRSDPDVEALREGAFVTVSVSWMPDYVAGERNLSRLAQVISRRNRDAAWTRLSLVDAGSDNAPLAPPTLGTITSTAAGVVSIPIATVPSGSEGRVDIAIQTLEPDEDSEVWEFLDRAGVSTITTPILDSASVVWVRARSEETGERPSAWIAAVNHTVPTQARIVDAEIDLDEAGTPRVYWTGNPACLGVRIHYERHLPSVEEPAFANSIDVDVADLNAILSLIHPTTIGFLFSVELEPFTGWTGSAVSGSAGPRQLLEVVGTLDLETLPSNTPPFEDLEWHGPFDEGSGLTLRDHSGNTRDAAPESGGAAITWVRGISGMAIDFPGSGVGYELLSDALAGAIEGLFYVSFWIKVDDVAGDVEARIIGRDSSDYWAVKLEQDEAFPQDIVFAYSDTQTVTLNDAITTAGVWYFGLAQWDVPNTTVELWIGSEATGLLTRIFRSESLAAFASTSRPIVLGSGTEASPTDDSHFDGSIDDVRIGAPAALLTHAEVLALFRIPGDGAGLIDAVRPEIFVKEVRGSTTSVVTIDVEDTQLRVTAIEYKKRDGVEGGDTLDASFQTAWTSTVGTIGTDETLQRVIDVPVDAGLEGELQWRVQWTDAYGNTQTDGDSFKVVNLEASTGSVMVSFADVVVKDESATFAVQFLGGYIEPNVTATQVLLIGSLLFPPGVTLTGIELVGYRNAIGDQCAVSLYRIANTSTSNSIQSAVATHDTTGWQVKTATTSHVVDADTIYFFQVFLNSQTSNADARFRGFKVNYDRPSYEKTL